MKTLKYNGVFWAVCMGVGLSGCVVAPPMQRGVVVQQPPPVYVQPGYPQPMYPQALYPPPVYVAPPVRQPRRGLGVVGAPPPRLGLAPSAPRVAQGLALIDALLSASQA